uniref:LicD family protein n=2 Tax=Caenorhabditis tropicalis TaxID=1561998 RepID=A0A1I7SY63_9PELO
MVSDKCQQWLLQNIQLSFPALLIDERVLEQLGDCDQINIEGPIKIAMSNSFPMENKNLDILFYSNHTEKDYLEIIIDQTDRKIIPKNFRYSIIGNLMIPTQIPLFLEFWRRGTFLSCRNMTVHRDPARNKYLMFFRKFLFPQGTPIPVMESIELLARLRDEMLRFGVIPFLNGGTFLGWYRECSVIPHTTDMDMAVFEEDWNPNFYEFLWSHNSSFRVTRQMGLVNDSYELTLKPKTGFRTPIDLFLMYRDGEKTRWVGGVATSGIKYKFIYPNYDSLCAGDLMGHLFWVPCNPEQKIKKEYGPYWYLDKNSSKHIFHAAKNCVENGRFTREQMKMEAYNEYKA